MVEAPSVRRITVELSDQARHPSSHFSAGPVSNDIFDWHFTLKGPTDTPFHGGLYHGRLILPVQYPHKPPKFIMLTPNGRFETNKEICMSMSSYHPDTWQPAWTIRTMLEGLVSFLPEEHASGIGAINSSPETRRKLAESSVNWRCSECNASNSEIWEAHTKKLELLAAPTEESKAPAPVEESKTEQVGEEEKKDEEIQTQGPPNPPAAGSVSSEPTEPEVVTLQDGERVVYPSESEIRSFVSKMDLQVIGLDIVIAVLTGALVWLLYFAS